MKRKTLGFAQLMYGFVENKHKKGVKTSDLARVAESLGEGHSAQEISIDVEIAGLRSGFWKDIHSAPIDTDRYCRFLYVSPNVFTNPASPVKAVAFLVDPEHDSDAATQRYWLKRAAESISSTRGPLPRGYYSASSDEYVQSQVRNANAVGLHAFAVTHRFGKGELALSHRLSIQISGDLKFCLAVSASELNGADDYALEEFEHFWARPEYLRLFFCPVLIIGFQAGETLRDGVIERLHQVSRRMNTGDPVIFACSAETSELDFNQFHARIVSPVGPGYESPNELFSKDGVRSYADFAGTWEPVETPDVRPFYSTVFPDVRVHAGDAKVQPRFPGPSLYKMWLKKVLTAALSHQEDWRFAFIHAWNDWAHEAAIEPDTCFGNTYLLATRESLEFANRLHRQKAGLADLAPDPDLALSPAQFDSPRLRSLRRAYGKRTEDGQGNYKFRDVTSEEYGIEPGLEELLSQKPDRPVVIFQMGKVGSISVMRALDEVKETDRSGKVLLPARNGSERLQPLLHLHAMADLDDLALQINLENADPHVALMELERGRLIGNWIKSADKTAQINVVTMVRDPIGRNFSGFFHDLEQVIPDLGPRFLADDISPEEILETFLYAYSWEAPEWFKYQFRPFFGLDVYEHPFDPEQGYSIIEQGQLRVLLFRMKDMTRTAPEAMKRFLGIEGFQLDKHNTSEQKYYAPLVERVRRLPLPGWYVDKMLSLPMAEHFYTEAERESLRSLYLQQNG